MVASKPYTLSIASAATAYEITYLQITYCDNSYYVLNIAYVHIMTSEHVSKFRQPTLTDTVESRLKVIQTDRQTDRWTDGRFTVGLYSNTAR